MGEAREFQKFRGKMIELTQNVKGKNEFKDNDLVCYCFEYTKKDIESDYDENGKSVIYENIVSEKKRGGCNCTSRNPKGK